MEQNLWYQNDGGLTLELCENMDYEIYRPPEKCCSCNEAKYEVPKLVLIFGSTTTWQLSLT